MKNTLYLSIISSGILALMSSCKNGHPSDELVPWTETERKQFEQECYLSASFSFEQLEQNVDSAEVVRICSCTADEISSQYSYKAAKRLPKAKVNEILGQALEKCSPEQSSGETTPVDSTAEEAPITGKQASQL